MDILETIVGVTEVVVSAVKDIAVPIIGKIIERRHVEKEKLKGIYWRLKKFQCKQYSLGFDGLENLVVDCRETLEEDKELSKYFYDVDVCLSYFLRFRKNSSRPMFTYDTSNESYLNLMEALRVKALGKPKKFSC